MRPQPGALFESHAHETFTESTVASEFPNGSLRRFNDQARGRREDSVISSRNVRSFRSARYRKLVAREVAVARVLGRSACRGKVDRTSNVIEAVRN
jgi:hypothetical protein